jgi:UDP:flavonoid glycosyltransferase YjiC (YdhE family)
LPQEKPVVLLTLGSSGRADLLPMALSALSGLPITVIAATAGKIDLAEVPGNAFVADYLPLDRAVQRSRLVICNGGSLTTYQALASGVPILGLCTNMDQLLNMNAIERLGAGLSLRAARSARTNCWHQPGIARKPRLCPSSCSVR